jgi:hypothetical protein
MITENCEVFYLSCRHCRKSHCECGKNDDCDTLIRRKKRPCDPCPTGDIRATGPTGATP